MRAFLGLVFMLGMLVHSPLAQAQGRPASVLVEEVHQDQLAQTMPVIGRIVTLQRAVIAAEIAGPVQDMMVEVGQRVEKGDALVQLRKDRMEAQHVMQNAGLREQRAALNTVQQRLALAQQEEKRLSQLKGSAAFSPARLDDKRLEVQTLKAEIGEAQAAVQIARAQLDLAQIDLDRTTIKAPFSGIVLEKQVEAGDYVNTGGGLLVLMNDRKLEIEADIPTDRLAGLTYGRSVSFHTRNKRDFPAEVRAIIPEENSLTRTQAVRFAPSVENIGQFAAGQSVTVYIPIGESRSVTLVHKDAVMVGQDSPFVYAVREGKAVIQPVNLGDAVGSHFEVLSGLQEGDLVVTRGNERLRPNQAVTF